MKKLHIIDHLGLGGAQTIVKGIFEIQKENKKIFLFSLRKINPKININHPNIIINNSNKKYSLSSIKELKKIIKKEKIEILHCHLFKAQLIGWLLKKYYFPNIQLIQHEHGKIFTNKKIYNHFIKLSEKKTNLFLAVSKTTKKELIKNLPNNPKKIKILHNFVNLNKFSNKITKKEIYGKKEKLKISKKEFIIGYMGRLNKIKGCKYLIKSLPHLNIKYKCIIAGDGKEMQNLKNLTKKLKIEDKIIFLGHIKNPEKHYPLFDIFIMPSLSESFGISVIEAQSQGIPIIASNIETFKEIVTDNKNCLLFESKNPIDLSKKIIKIYKNRNLKNKLIKNGLENVKKYSLDNYIKQLNKIYTELK